MLPTYAPAQDIVIVDYEATCAAGTGLDAIRKSISTQTSGLRRNDFLHSDLTTWIGRVPDVDNYLWSEEDTKWQSRNNALIDIALAQGTLLTSLDRLKTQFGAARIGIVIGSSTSSIDRSEEAYRQLDENGHIPPEFIQENVLNPHAPGLFVAHRLGLSGPNMTINTACSSSAKVFATATRWLNAGIVDAVLVGGADTLCLSVLHGFHSLQLISESPCKPFDTSRDGINLGEAAAFALLTKAGLVDQHTGVQVSGYGESSDAYHMSHPHPEGEGARLAIEQALQQAKLNPSDIDYINLHGTASRANDHIEGNVIGKMFGANVLASSTKGWTGHTLGAAGIIESILAIEALRSGIVPGTLHLEAVDPEIAITMSAHNQTAKLRHVMSNSFGFGGNNASLIFSHATGSNSTQPQRLELNCELVGIGAWGPGFSDWQTLKDLLLNDSIDEASLVTSTPKPEVIPANERRRAPLPVKAAVDVSWQALQQSGISSEEVACVFASGLGDTEITDYMCRVLTTQEKQLSPTKFHNSVHNAAAGYWTISTHCMKSANSIAAYQKTVGLALLEGFTQCVLLNEPVLITLFDTAAHEAYRQIFACEYSFAAALLIRPATDKALSGSSYLAKICLTEATNASAESTWSSETLSKLYQDNPAAKVLDLLNAIARTDADMTTDSSVLPISSVRSIALTIK